MDVTSVTLAVLAAFPVYFFEIQHVLHAGGSNCG